jgi:hypothetical protein
VPNVASHIEGSTLTEKGVSRTICGPKWEKVIVAWRKLHNEEFHYLYSSPNINRVISSRRLRRAGRKTYRGDEKCIQILIVKSGGKRLHENVGVYGRTVLK